MASYGFGKGLRQFSSVKLPSGDFYMNPGPGQVHGSGFDLGPYSSLVSSISQGFDFFKDLAEPDYRQPGMTSQESRQAKKNSDFGIASKGAGFALQLLFTILMFAL